MSIIKPEPATIKDAINQRLTNGDLRIAFGRELRREIDSLQLGPTLSYITQFIGKHKESRGFEYSIGRDTQVLATLTRGGTLMIYGGKEMHDLIVPLAKELNQRERTNYLLLKQKDSPTPPFRIVSPFLRDFYRRRIEGELQEEFFIRESEF